MADTAHNQTNPVSSGKRFSLSIAGHPQCYLPKPASIRALHIGKNGFEIGVVENYITARGYGFIESPDGNVFFHASGFRTPRIDYDEQQTPPQPKIGLIAMLLPKDKSNPPRHEDKLVPVPPIPKGTELIYELGLRNGKPQAKRWCIKQAYDQIIAEADMRHEEEWLRWTALPMYKLAVHRRRYGGWRADNVAKKMVRDEVIDIQVLFEGTNLEFLQSWFSTCKDYYHIGPDLWLTLSHRDYDQRTKRYGEWQPCPTEVMEEFLSLPTSTITM